MKKLFPFLFVLFTPSFYSQNPYTFTQTTGNTYADLSGDKQILSFNAGGIYPMLDFAGETFNFYDLPFNFGGLTRISVGSGPFLRVDNDSSLVIVDVAFTYITNIDSTSRISYKVLGSPGTRTLILQYKNFKLTNGPTGNFINTQIWYHQQSEVIELHYGPRSLNNASGYNTVNGPNVGIFYSPHSFSECYSKLWVNGSPAAPTLDSASNFVFNAMSGVPEEGTIYRFSPRTKTVSTVSIKEYSKETGLLLYPNPAINEVVVRSKYPEGIIILTDIAGKRILKTEIKNGGALLNVQEISQGCYFVKCFSKTGEAEVLKLLIDR